MITRARAHCKEELYLIKLEKDKGPIISNRSMTCYKGKKNLNEIHHLNHRKSIRQLVFDVLEKIRFRKNTYDAKYQM